MGIVAGEQKLDPEVQIELDKATVAMSKAKALIDEGELIKADVKEKILPLMAAFGVEKSEVEGTGTIAYRSGGGSSINPKKLTEVLLLKGMGAGDITKVIKDATKSWSYNFVEFRAATKE